MDVAEKFYRAVLGVTPFVQGLSCDEVLADVSHLVAETDDAAILDARRLLPSNGSSGADCPPQGNSACWTRTGIAKHIRDHICRSTGGCTASVGIGKNRLLARLATKSAKPSPSCEGCQALRRCRHSFAKACSEEASAACQVHKGVFKIRDCDAQEHLDALPVRELPGVGAEAEKQLARLGVTTVQELRILTLPVLREAFGAKQAQSLHSLARGVDERPWEPRPRRKSVGAQISWGVRFTLQEQVQAFCKQLTDEALRRLARHGSSGASLTVKLWRAKPGAGDAGGVGHGMCDIISRTSTISLDPAAGIHMVNMACSESWRLFASMGAPASDVRGLGVHIGGLQQENQQPRRPEVPPPASASSSSSSAAMPRRRSLLGMLRAEPEGASSNLGAPAVAKTCANIGSSKESGRRVVLHLDVNCFFLAVHEKFDPSLREAGPLVLWQYNDVICVSPEAKAAGVRKHMRPSEAQPMVQAVGGRMVHAFSRRWPGPRVWYGPYQAVSREMFATLRRLLDDKLPPGQAVLERTSVDEAFLELLHGATGGCLEQGAAVGRYLADELRKELGVQVSVGVARNRLLAKLGSVAAKPPHGNGLRLVDDGEAFVGQLLEETPVTRLPGLGGREEQLTSLGIRSAADLQRLGSGLELGAALGGLSGEAAHRLAEACHGRDGDAPVRVAEPKKSLVVTSWLTDTCLADVAVRDGDAISAAMGSSQTAVAVGKGWVFEPQLEKGVTNLTRGRWLLLSLVLDLEERVVEEFLDAGQLPTKLTVSFEGPGWRREPGPGSTDGRSRSRTGAFPTAAFKGLEPEDGRVSIDVTVTSPSGRYDANQQELTGTISTAAPSGTASGPRCYQHPVYGSDWLSVSGSSAVLSDGPELLTAPRRGPRLAALTDAVGDLIRSWASELGSPVPIAKLSLTAAGMVESRDAKRRLGPAQTTLADCFKRTKVKESTPGKHVAAVEVIDIDLD
eukprot:TRINITY_DN22669_c0_g1_i1.p1 TRINITY_DN22669_c0_g1~~TRINITY_DN22669_c0_g1_i1.p1  ORF type:complete len:1006 (-),score=195.95 TRINITY_DN22669_c0_g1_i1:111-3002(-)